MTRRPGVAVAAAAAAALVAAGWIRLHNLLHYPRFFGFDAEGNWQYVARLMRDWSLPAPDAGWATSHPPFFYYVSAALGRLLADAGPAVGMLAVRGLASAASLGIAVLAAAHVWRREPAQPQRALLAGLLLLFLPVHLYMSPMLNEELLASLLVSAAVVGLARQLGGRAPDGRHAAALGAVAGLALLTKLTGGVVVAAGGLAYAIDGARRGDARGGLSRAAAFGIVALGVGGWYYGLNLVRHGYLYPANLDVHAIMFEMPPGERGWLDFVRFPLATFRDPQLLHPDLLHSVWGGTYATLWFDGHRHFLPQQGEAVRRTGLLLTTLGLLPTGAFVVGVGRALVRLRRGEGAADLPFLLLIAGTLAGYVLFSLRNPWFAAVKASYLLGLSVPFAVYASGELQRWAESGRVARVAVTGGLVLLLATSALTFTIGACFVKTEGPGLPWQM